MAPIGNLSEAISTLPINNNQQPLFLSEWLIGFLTATVAMFILMIVLGLVLAFRLRKSNNNNDNNYNNDRVGNGLANRHHEQSTSFGSPDASGRFAPPIWCTVCNLEFTHVDELCVHLGRRLFVSSAARLYQEMWWQRRAMERQQQPPPVRQPINSCGETMDLDDLFIDADNHQYFDEIGEQITPLPDDINGRKTIKKSKSRASGLFGSLRRTATAIWRPNKSQPRESSTPTARDRPHRIRRWQTDIGDRVVIQPRIASCNSSGYGSNLTCNIQQTMDDNNPSTVDLASRAPRILVHRPSTSGRRRLNSENRLTLPRQISSVHLEQDGQECQSAPPVVDGGHPVQNVNHIYRSASQPSNLLSSHRLNLRDASVPSRISSLRIVPQADIIESIRL